MKKILLLLLIAGMIFSCGKEPLPDPEPTPSPYRDPDSYPLADIRDQYVGTYRCAYIETITTSVPYRIYVYKNLADTLIDVTKSSIYANGIDILSFTFIFDVDGNIVNAYANHGFNEMEHNYRFRVKGDSLFFKVRWGGSGGAMHYEVEGKRVE